ncbi:MAG TPA: hypothetical protein VF503_32595 [Sphingobium sp.]|uniref:hypothetical protein n=1 Tax=Sphingobium sp. TaxID=1912891 RepID=UPI002ED33F3C
MLIDESRLGRVIVVRGYLIGAALLGLACGSGPACAQLSVDRLWVDFEPGIAPRADVVIRNESEDRYYITVTPAEITNPGTDQEKRVEMADPEALGLLVTPNRLVIDPNGIRSIRIVSLDTNLEKDRIYRVKITPQVGDLQSKVAAGGKGIAIKVLAAYDILVTARPGKAKAELSVARGPGELVIRNVGNSNTLLYEGQACATKAAAKPESCTSLGARRLYSGNEWKIAIPADQPQVHFKQRSLASSDPKEVGF